MSIARSIGSGLAVAISAALHGDGFEAPTMPSGAIGLWFADSFVDSPRRHIPNEIGTPSVTANLLAFPRRQFANAELWNKAATVVDDAVTGPSGNVDASTVNGLADWSLGPAFATSLPAGTYTLAAWVKRNAGVDQTFAWTNDNTSTRSTAQFATSAWTRSTYTFSKGSPFPAAHLRICDATGLTPANIQIDGFELYAGSSDMADSVSGNMVLGGTNASTTTVTAGQLDLSGGSDFSSIQFPTNIDMTAVTVVAVVQKVTSGSTLQAIASKVQNYTAFSAMTDRSTSRPVSFFGGATYDYGFAGLWRLLDKQPQMITHTANASGTELWLNNCRMFVGTGGIGTVTIRDLFVGVVSSLSLTSGLKLQGLAIYDRVLTLSEIESAYSAMSARSAIPPAPTIVTIAEGDSITAADGSYAYLHGPAATTPQIGGVWATNGAGLATLTGRAAALDQCIGNAPKHILSVLIGANDLKSYSSAAQYITDFAAYCAARRAAGWLVVVCTILPQTDATHNTRRASVNAAIAGWVGINCDAIADFASNTTMGDDADAANITYYSDGLHPTAAGQAVLQPILTAAVDAL
jgi:lysophospholipase L1-like esterase